jgi:GTP-dependent dephospho-CoA kinase
MLILPEEHRRLFKEPFGILYPTIEEVLPNLKTGAVYAVGDVVTHNLQKNGIIPAVAIVDGYTMRSPCRKMPEMTANRIRVKNPAGCLTDDLMHALDQAVAHPPVTIMVDGEEDLAVIPMVIAAPLGSIVLYGQPHEGVVLRTVTRNAKQTAREYLSHFRHIADE